MYLETAEGDIPMGSPERLPETNRFRTREKKNESNVVDDKKQETSRKAAAVLGKK
ncbi:hypothetical protein HN512_05290 [Candidatus Peregrinibacteria bacterium]|jgi:hypothetical protein|nr:hypothetical protein [Candidatus Peregrinibacteria bacterium]MBT3599220.1 hypothetical protein [Candidatus Peregrinibacteria bacterium]MBT4367473.1 hypothetical protein [Candidatus Peregrinibacteria bacterium]MBT4585593.1 hypothetical protein [Candidatus Peregrinibacteria bacterium]MBT6731021.1 hypothetical protein [Candidatus Peregrinibacteria bacterium]